jgi:hypothetical protein
MTQFLLAGLFILVVVYMTYPRFRRRRLSAARFFKDLPPPRRGQSRLRWGKIRFTLPFFIQLLILLSLLAALYLLEKKLSGQETKGLGVWIVVDTSASMSTKQQGETRMTIALREVDRAVSMAQTSARGKELCFRLSTLDLEQRDLVTKGDIFAVNQAIDTLEPRPLGTDLSILRRLIRSLNDPSRTDDQCRVSHLVIITDHPAPGWLWESRDIRVVWRDIGQPVNNVGFTNIRAARNPLTGLVSNVQMEVASYGKPKPVTRLTVFAPDGSKIKDEPLLWQQKHQWQGAFTPSQAGQYKLTISPGGAYAYDDTAVIRIGGGQEIRVDWQLADRRLLRRMGWTQDSISPQLKVTARASEPITTPTLIVGPGYGRIRTNPIEIRDFLETSPLLADVNLDVVETLGLRGIDLPKGFQPVLRGMNGKTWLAQAGDPVSAVVPGLPTGTNDITGRFSTTVFFNAVRWLLQKQEMAPLYTLTGPHAPLPQGNRIVLHKDEGNTQRTSKSYGKLQQLKPVSGKGTSKPIWPILVMVAIILFLVERTLAVSSAKGTVL